MSWFYLIIAGCFEILGVVLLNQLARISLVLHNFIGTYLCA